MKSLLAAASAAALVWVAPASAADFGYDESDTAYEIDGQSYAEEDYPVPSDTPDADYVEPSQPSSGVYFEEEGQGYAPAYKRHKRQLAGDCLTRRGLRTNLISQGWRDLRGIAADPDVIGLTASRPNGLVYHLKIDRCSGVILAAYLLDQGGNGGAYAYGSQDVPGY
jgi:hypothetical protein